MTTTPNPTTKEVVVSHFSVSCPCGSGHVVEASDAGFSATTVTVAACPTCRTAGIASREMRKSWGYSNAVPVSAGLQHRDGLVVMVG